MLTFAQQVALTLSASKAIPTDPNNTVTENMRLELRDGCRADGAVICAWSTHRFVLLDQFENLKVRWVISHDSEEVGKQAGSCWKSTLRGLLKNVLSTTIWFVKSEVGKPSMPGSSSASRAALVTVMSPKPGFTTCCRDGERNYWKINPNLAGQIKVRTSTHNKGWFWRVTCWQMIFETHELSFTTILV